MFIGYTGIYKILSREVRGDINAKEPIPKTDYYEDATSEEKSN